MLIGGFQSHAMSVTKYIKDLLFKYKALGHEYQQAATQYSTAYYWGQAKKKNSSYLEEKI